METKSIKTKKINLSKLCLAYVEDPENDMKKNAAFAELFPRLKNFAFKIVHNQEEAYDIAVMTVEKALKSFHMFNKDKASYSTWIFTICRNFCYANYYDKKKMNQIDTDISDTYDSLSFNNDYVQDDESDMIMHDNAIKRLRKISRDECLEAMYNTSINEMQLLNPRVASIMKSKLVDGMSIKDIAQERKCSESAVKYNLFIGKESLRNTMKTKHSDLYDVYVKYC